MTRIKIYNSDFYVNLPLNLWELLLSAALVSMNLSVISCVLELFRKGILVFL